MTKETKSNKFSLNQKGSFGMGDIMMLGISVIILYIAIIIFIPFANLLGNATSNMTNGAIFMSLVWVMPLLLVGMMIYGFAMKAQNER